MFFIFKYFNCDYNDLKFMLNGLRRVNNNNNLFVCIGWSNKSYIFLNINKSYSVYKTYSTKLIIQYLIILFKNAIINIIMSLMYET